MNGLHKVGPNVGWHPQFLGLRRRHLLQVLVLEIGQLLELRYTSKNGQVVGLVLGRFGKELDWY